MTTLKDQQPEDGNAMASTRARKPYQSPKLRRLGSVRELTLGTNNGKPEGVTSRRPPGM